MPPRDLWDLNPVYQLHFWASYSDLLEIIGFQEDPDNEGLMIYEFQTGEEEEVVVIEDVLEAAEELNWEDMVGVLGADGLNSGSLEDPDVG